jgi:hypothetical protein
VVANNKLKLIKSFKYTFGQANVLYSLFKCSGCGWKISRLTKTCSMYISLARESRVWRNNVIYCSIKISNRKICTKLGMFSYIMITCLLYNVSTMVYNINYKLMPPLEKIIFHVKLTSLTIFSLER